MYRDHKYPINNLNKTSQISRYVFYGVWLAVFVVSVIFLVNTHGRYVNSLIYGRGKDRFMDFFNHISYVRENGMANVYQTSIHACFPPLIYFMYYFFSLILPQNATVMYLASLTSSYALLLYVWYCVAITVLLCYTVMKMMPKTGSRHKLALTGIIITSNIFIFGVLERGNSVIIACLLLMWAIILRNSDKKYKQEMALIMIAIAASVKIYPAVFGLIYIFEKQWRKAARLVLYGLCFFFIPFCFFGGWEGFCAFLSNQMTVQAESYAGLSSIRSLYYYIAQELNFAPSDWAAIIMVAVYSALAVLASYAHKSTWKRIYLLTGIMILCPFWSGSYTLIFLSIPLIQFMSNENEIDASSNVNILYAALFALTFSFCAISGTFTNELSDLPFATVVNYIPIYIINVLLICSGLLKLYKRIRQ